MPNDLFLGVGTTGVPLVGQTRPKYNPARRAAALEALLRKLPSVDDPEPVRRARNVAGRAKQLKEEQESKLVAAYEDGAKIHELSRRFRINRQTVHNILIRNGVTLRTPGLDAEQIEEAVKLYEEGWSLDRIGQRMGVDDMTVRARLLERGVMMRPRRGGRT